MRKRSKLWLALLAVVMILGQCMTALAATDNTFVQKVNSITMYSSENKKVSSVAMVTNDGKNTMEVTLKWQWNRTDSTQQSAGVVVSTSNRAVVSLPAETERTALTGEAAVVKEKKNYTTMENTCKIKLTAVSNGSATITVKSTDGKKKATLKVKVTTLADGINCANTYVVDGKEYINVAMKGSVNLGASISNSNVSNKGLTYKVTTADDKKAVKVAGNGVVSASNKYNDGTAVITIASKDKNVSKDVYVNVCAATEKLVPVQDNTSTKDVLGELNKKNVVAMKGNRTSAAYTYTLKMKDVDAKDLVYVSNKPAVATVDANGKITAKGNGTAIITVSYKNDSKKTAKVTVKVTTDVETMTVAANDFTIVANGSATADINAKVNANASNKSVVYTITRVTANGNTYTDKKDIAKYASVASNGKVKAKQPCVITVQVVSKANSKVSQAVTVTAIVPVYKVAIKENGTTITKRAFTLKDPDEGKQLEDTFTLTAEATGKDTEPTNKAVIWTSSKPAVATVDANGVVTVKAKGSAVITATAADGSKKSAKITLNVKDERRASNPTAEEKKEQAAYAKELAAVKKAVDASINTAMKDEVRDYLGFKTKFTASTGIFAVDIVDPNVKLDDLSNTGLAALADSLARQHSVRTVTVTLDGVTHTATHKNGKIYVDEDTTFEFTDYKGAISYIQNTYLAERPVTKNWNGASVTLGIVVEQVKDGVTKQYPLTYTMNFTMSDKLYLQTVADTMAAEIAKLNVTGVSSIAVSGKDITVEVMDINQDIKAADAANRQNVLDALNVIFEDAQKVTVSTNIPVAGGQTAITKERTAGNTQADFMNDLLDEYLDKLYAKATTYGALDGSTVVVNVTYQVGSKTYADTYNLYLVMADEAFDKAADQAVEAAITSDFDFGTVTYDAANNAFAVTFNKAFAGKDKDALAGSGLATVIDSLIKSQNVQSVKVDGVKVDDPTAMAISLAMANSCKVLGELQGKTSTMEVVYQSPSKVTERKISYTISFDVVMEVKADKAIAAAINAKGYEFGTASYDAASNTLSVVIKSDKADMVPSDLANTGLITAIQKVMDDMSVTAVNVNGSDYVGASAFDICVKQAAKYATIGELNGKSIPVTVTYNGKDVISYTITFVVEAPEKSDVSANDAVEETVAEPVEIVDEDVIVEEPETGDEQ